MSPKIVTVVNFDKVSFEMNDILRVFHFNSKWRVSAVIFTDCFVFFQIEKKVAIEKSSARIAISFFVVVTRTTTRKC